MYYTPSHKVLPVILCLTEHIPMTCFSPIKVFKWSDMHEQYEMAESETSSDTGGQAKVEAWMDVGLKSAAEDRTDDLEISMAEYVRFLMKNDIAGAGTERDEIEA